MHHMRDHTHPSRALEINTEKEVWKRDYHESITIQGGM